jgi:hypothetical protein
LNILLLALWSGALMDAKALTECINMSRLNWVAVGSNQDLVNKQTLHQEIFAEV